MKYPIDAYIQPSLMERLGKYIGRFIDLVGLMGLLAVGYAAYAIFADPF